MGAKEKTMGIVILHGWATETAKWDPFLKEMKGTLLKIPGLTQNLSKPWILDDYVQWLKKKIAKKAILIGHSNGGRIALAFAAQYPQKVEKLVLISSGGIYHKELTLQIKRLLFKTAAKIGKKIALSGKMKNILYKLAGESDYNSADLIQKQTMVNLISTDLTPILSRINIPTLIIWGQQDQTTPVSDGKLIHKLIRGSKLEIIKGARHSPQFTHPKEVARLINEYI